MYLITYLGILNISIIAIVYPMFSINYYKKKKQKNYHSAITIGATVCHKLPSNKLMMAMHMYIIHLKLLLILEDNCVLHLLLAL